MINFKFKNIQGSLDYLNERVKSITKEEKLMKEISEALIKDIKFQTRRGKNGLTSEKLKPLSEKWIEERAKIAKSINTADAYSKKRSNLTLSGQLLDSIKSKITQNKISLFFYGNHSPYTKNKKIKKTKKLKRGKSIVNANNSSNTVMVGKSIKNADLAQYIEDGGRQFFVIRPKMIEQVKKIVLKFMRNKIT